jgi:MshEN domain
VSSSDLTHYGEVSGLRPPDTESTAAHGSPEVSPELALVDPTLSSEPLTEGSPDREVIVSSNAPSEGTFFVDHQPAAPAPAPAPVAPVAPVAPAAPAEPVEQQPDAAAIGGGMRDVPLGTLIFRAGLLAEEQLEDALQEGMRTGKRLGEVLVERGLIRDSELGRLLAGQRGLSYVEVSTVSVDPEAVRMLPDNIARMQNALAFAFDDGVPVVAVADPTNELVIENVRRALGTEPGLVVAAHGELARRINEVYSGSPPAAEPAEAAPAPVAAAAAAPAPEPAPAPAPEAPVQAEQPAPALPPTPMPTVMPPAEERPAEPEPLVAAVVPAEVPPLHAEAAEQPPLAPEPVAAPAPAPQPVTEPEPVQVQPVEPAPVEQQPAEPVIVVAELPVTAEPVVTAEAMVAPTEPGLFTQAAVQALAPAAEPPAAPAPPEPQLEQSAHTNGSAPDVVPTHFVVLRLAQDDHVQIGGFSSRDEAESFARTVVGRIGRAEEQGEWPVFEDRFLRPQTIVSVDVVEGAPPEWGGSLARSRSFEPSA